VSNPARTDQRCLTVPEAAAYLSISRGQLYQLIGRCEIGSITIGRSRRVPISALEEYVTRRLHESA
jgi:excisionase family DNA binding protein